MLLTSRSAPRSQTLRLPAQLLDHLRGILLGNRRVSRDHLVLCVGMGWGRRVVRWSCSILRQPKTAPPRALQQARKLDADECWAERAAGCVCSRGHCARRPASSPMQERGAARQGKQMHRFVHRQPVPLVRPRRRCCLYACVWPRCLALPSTARCGRGKDNTRCCSCDHRRQAQAKHGSSTVFRTPPLRPA